MSDSKQSKRMTVDEARARKAEIIGQVRNGTPPLWMPKPGWSDRFSDDTIWDAVRRVAERGPMTPMMVAAELVENVIDGSLRA